MVHQVRSYVLRPGRITRLQLRSLEELTDRYCVGYREQPLNLAALFPEAETIILEIGFGMGMATAEIAEANPHVGYLGIEVFRAGVGKLLSEIERRGLSNVRIISHDAVDVCRVMIPDGSLDGVHLFFPDPWPKKRHHKRRLMQRPFVELLSAKLKQGGYLYTVSDWDDYAAQILKVCEDSPELRNEYAGYAPPRPWRPKTKFERKGIANHHSIREVYFTKL